MGSRQDEIIKVLKKSKSGMTAKQLATKMNYSGTRLRGLLNKLKSWELVEYDLIENKKIGVERLWRII